MRMALSVVALVMITLVESSVATASAPAEATAETIEREDLLDRLASDRAITVARERRVADEQLVGLLEQLEAEDRALRQAEVKAEGNQAMLARLRRARRRLAKERRVTLEKLVALDEQLAVEVRVYREEVSKIAESPDPRKLAALMQFADGEEREALAVLDEIRKANATARRAADALKDEAEAKQGAWLEGQTRGRRPNPKKRLNVHALTRQFEEQGLSASSTKTPGPAKPGAAKPDGPSGDWCEQAVSPLEVGQRDFPGWLMSSRSIDWWSCGVQSLFGLRAGTALE